MKTTILFTLMAATLMTSACGSDSKKSQTQSTLFHKSTGDGYCIEAVQEAFTSRGLSLPDNRTAGACPQETTISGSIRVTRHASCPITLDDGVQATAVIYSQVIGENGEVLDLSAETPEAICQVIN